MRYPSNLFSYYALEQSIFVKSASKAPPSTVYLSRLHHPTERTRFVTPTQSLLEHSRTFCDSTSRKCKKGNKVLFRVMSGVTVMPPPIREQRQQKSLSHYKSHFASQRKTRTKPVQRLTWYNSVNL